MTWWQRLRRSRWWHEMVLRHRLRSECSRARMVTWCECGECWVTVGDPRAGWSEPGDLS